MDKCAVCHVRGSPGSRASRGLWEGKASRQTLQVLAALLPSASSSVITRAIALNGHPEFGIGRFVDFERHFVRFALDVGDGAVNAADRHHAIVLLEIFQQRCDGRYRAAAAAA